MARGRIRNFGNSFYDLKLFNVKMPERPEPYNVTTTENLVAVSRSAFEAIAGYDAELGDLYDGQELRMRPWTFGFRGVCDPGYTFTHQHPPSVMET